MTVEVLYFPKPCPHCKEPLFRSEHRSMAWSECCNKTCPFIVSQVPEKKTVRGIDMTSDPEPYTECLNRR